ncbi:hypothetical protein QNO00_14605 [Arthrobacter sp. zg-Y1219]|uniref:DsrE family protein n=1 Tax=Arthrobacter sp. zg-Y1219 TaxID=3049067 RepID=UPI0024C36F28|nr:hypothetical protein [Arthrobacter sp. zg-Y1219]MDK1361487.1 hypothetical protein [Arthrobacter sp. zg-Y1219]
MEPKDAHSQNSRPEAPLPSQGPLNQGPPNPGLPGLVIHGSGPDSGTWLAGLLRSAVRARSALGSERPLEVVVQGFGVRLLRLGIGDPSVLDAALSGDIHVLACENSMSRADVHKDELHRGVETVDAAVAHLARRQWEGWAYVRL